MIHPNTQIQYLDISDGEPRYKSVNELYQEYSHMIKIDDLYGNEYIRFGDNSNIMITDLFGWTKLIEIKKLNYNKSDLRWFNIYTKDTNVTVSHNSLIPIYNICDTTIGFHGEVKFLYNVKSANEISINDDYLRIHYLGNKNPNIINEFSKPNNISIIINPSITYGYKIITKSKFFNGNNIHLYAANNYQIEESIKKYK